MGNNTGFPVERDGVYRCTSCENEQVFREGETFEPCWACGWAVGWLLKRLLPPERRSR